MSFRGVFEVYEGDVDFTKTGTINGIAKPDTNGNGSVVEHKSKKPFKREIVWKNALVYAISHLIGLYGLYLSLFHLPGYQAMLVLLLSYVHNVLGVTMGAHRYYSHRCFKASQTLKAIILIAQTAASQNCMWVWVRDHRLHHKYTDTDADPHNASNGFFFSHVGWLMVRKHPEVIKKGKGIDMSDLDADPLVMFQKKHYFALWWVFAFLLPILVPIYFFGEPWLEAIVIWGFTRLVLALNGAWLVNSWAHLYGTKPFDKSIMPRESRFVGFLTVGEGWHNYHHTFPWDYKASEFGAPCNVTSSLIRLFARLGMAWDLKEVSEETALARATKTGDGTTTWTRGHVAKN